jgi:uncharacterized protein (TIGR00730 family)
MAMYRRQLILSFNNKLNMTVNSIAIFCGSKSGNNPLYEAHAVALARMMAERNMALVYGGGNKGLMGAVANSAMEYGGKVIGVIPKVLLEWEAQHEGITELRVVEDMHVRKRMLYELCDAAVILAGGNGTLDELFEMVTWNNLKIHNKKIIILNSAGFYNNLIAHMDTMAEEGFLYGNWRERIIVCNDPEEAIGALA